MKETKKEIRFGRNFTEFKENTENVDKVTQHWLLRIEWANKILAFYIQEIESTLKENDFVKYRRIKGRDYDGFKVYCKEYNYYRSPDKTVRIKLPKNVKNFNVCFDLQETMDKLSAYFGEKDA